MSRVVGVIGIRSGSKGVADKNIRPLHGHPLVAWIIDQALAASTIDRVIVSTDSEHYADIARHYGAEVPFVRPAELAGDDVTDFPVLRHALDWLARHDGDEPEIVLRLLATVPLQLAEDLDAVVNVLDADPTLTSAMVVAEARQHPAKALRIEDGPQGRRLVSYLTGHAHDVEPRMRQAYAPAYVRANVVASRVSTLAEHGTLAGDKVGCHIIDQQRSVDVDTATDFEVLEVLMARQDRTIDRVKAFGATRR